MPQIAFLGKLKLNKNVLQAISRHYCAVQSQAKAQNSDLFATKYCMNLVQTNDYENYLCTLLIKGQQQRRHAFALRAFNVEVAKCGSNITEPQILKMRLQFWHDAIDKCFAAQNTYVADHPVLSELKNTLDTHKLTKQYLKRLVSSRDRALNQQFLSLKQMEDYAEQSCSSLYYLLVQLTSVKDVQVDHAMSHLGKAQGLATLLRAIPYTGRQQALNIPQDILIKHGVSQERILRQKTDDKGVTDCVFDVANAAFQHLEQAQKLYQTLPKQLRVFFLPAISVQRYLERLRKADFRLTHQQCLQRDAMLPLALYWQNLRSKF